jgi:hypothetical protein
VSPQEDIRPWEAMYAGSTSTERDYCFS